MVLKKVYNKLNSKYKSCFDRIDKISENTDKHVPLVDNIKAREVNFDRKLIPKLYYNRQACRRKKK